MKQASSLVIDLFRGWMVIIRSIGAVFAVIVSAGLISVTIVYPLWWLAIRHRGVYSLLSLTLLAVATVWFGVSSVLRSRRRHGYTRLHLSKRRRIARIVGIVTVPIVTYVIVVLFASNILAAAIPLSIVAAAAVGLLVTNGNRRTP